MIFLANMRQRRVASTSNFLAAFASVAVSAWLLDYYEFELYCFGNRIHIRYLTSVKRKTFNPSNNSVFNLTEYLLYCEGQQYYYQSYERHSNHDATYHVIRIIWGIWNKLKSTLESQL